MNDLISRQAVIEMLDETKRIARQNIDGAVLMTFERVFDSLVNITNALPTIQPEPHWIPVDLENNEPQLEEWVLVSSDGYVMQDCIVERGGKKIWYHGGNIQADDRYMPLPEPYKGGDNMKIIFVLRNGFTFGVTCEEFSLTRNGLGNYTGYEINGIKDNKPLFIRWEDVVLVYRADMDREVTE